MMHMQDELRTVKRLENTG